MQDFFTTTVPKKTITIVPIGTKKFDKWLKQQNTVIKNWLNVSKFTAKSGSICVLPDTRGHIYIVFLGIANENDFWAFSALPLKLPEGIYKIEANLNTKQLQRAIIAWGLGCYKFAIYTKNNPDITKAKLLIPDSCDRQYIKNVVDSIFLVRDLINYPAENETPEILGSQAITLAKKFGAKVNQIVGEDLLKKGFNAIYAVGRGSANKPRLIDLRWGDSKNPKVTLVGKGVCFDTGGLNLKAPSEMQTMKKDMAGAAHVLGLASMIMMAKLPINLRVLIPAVENMPSGNAYKQGDILKTYKGITVEIGNTDAEGRLILADVLTLACEESPELLIDFASLTGASRIALGTDIAAMFTNKDALATEIAAIAVEEQDPIWQLPLFEPYKELLESDMADISNIGRISYGGAITAAIFLQEFITTNTPWVHFDIMAFNLSAKPGRPKGGEAQGIRALFAYLCKKFAL
jgi:leucyl aminopeptidase